MPVEVLTVQGIVYGGSKDIIFTIEERGEGSGAAGDLVIDDIEASGGEKAKLVRDGVSCRLEAGGFRKLSVCRNTDRLPRDFFRFPLTRLHIAPCQGLKRQCQQAAPDRRNVAC